MTTQTPDDIDAAIAENATQPKSGTVDGVSFTNHDLSAQIEAAKHLRSQDAVQNLTGFPFRVARIIPPGGRR